jgi:hypothetical protein
MNSSAAWLSAAALAASISLAISRAVAARSVDSDTTSCRTSLSRLIAGAPASVVPPACWRVGPLTLGMSRAELDRAMGAPVQSRPVADSLAPGRAYTARVYAFPRTWRADLERGPVSNPHLRFVEVLLLEDRAVKIANNPPALIRGPACKAVARPPEIDLEHEPLGFAPFQAFNGVRVGDTLRSLEKWFGRAPEPNTTRDWYNYLPAPITFDVDPETARITGFAIGSDQDAVSLGAPVQMTVARDPATCRTTGISFRDDG